MKKRTNILWRISLILIVLISWTNESNAQFIPTIMQSGNILSPILSIASKVANYGKSKFPEMDLNSDEEKSYLNSSLFFFEENMLVCKDIFTGKNDSICISEESNETKRDTTTAKHPKRALEKKKSRSLWNHPGNTKSRI